jgi:hypothetical protein
MIKDELKMQLDKLNILISAKTGTGCYSEAIKFIAVSAKAELLLRNEVIDNENAEALINEIDEILTAECDKIKNSKIENSELNKNIFKLTKKIKL